MSLIAIVKGFFRNAFGIRNNANVERRDDGCGVHPFPSRRERALSDIRRVRMLVQAAEAESGGVANRGTSDSLRQLIPRLGELVSKQTGESSVYWNAAENAYYKVKSPSAKAYLKHTTEADWPYEHVIHNILFPNTAYELIAVARELGELRVVLKQNCVSSETFPTDEEVAEFLKREHGLVPEDRYWFGNELLAITDVGAKGDNVLKDDNGNLFFIDPLIRLKYSALDVIERLTTAASRREV